MKKLFINVAEAIGCNVDHQVDLKISSLCKTAVLPSDIIQNVSEYNENTTATLLSRVGNETVNESCPVKLHPREQVQDGVIGYRRVYYNKFHGNTFEVFKNNLYTNHIVAFPALSHERYSMLCNYEEYIKSKNVLLLNRDSECLRNHFMDGFELNEVYLNEKKNSAISIINSSVDQALKSPEVLPDNKYDAEEYTPKGAYKAILEKRAEYDKLVQNQKKFAHKCKAFGLNLLISFLVLVAIAAAGLGVYLYDKSSTTSLILGACGIVAWFGFMIGLVINNIANSKKNKEALKKIEEYNNQPEDSKLKTFDELKTYIKNTLTAYVNTKIAYIRRREDRPSPDSDLIKNLLYEYEKTGNFEVVIKKYAEVQLYKQLGLDAHGCKVQRDFTLINDALDIAERLHIGKVGQFLFAAISFVFVIIELILKIMEV